MRSWILAACLGLATLPSTASGQGPSKPEPPRMVLVELYTSQGCDMCPEAERVLGVIAAKNPRVVPIAFHVDYFNDPWKDAFSDKLHSERQAAYNALYTRPKNPEYGLYYTPMVMVDGVQSENGRDPEGIQAAVRQAQARKPLVSLEATLELKDNRSAGDLRVSLAPRSPGINGRELLVCAVLTDDRVVTEVGSGENANKTLTARFPAVDSVRVHPAGWFEGSEILVPPRSVLDCREARDRGLRAGQEVGRDLSVRPRPLDTAVGRTRTGTVPCGRQMTILRRPGGLGDPTGENRHGREVGLGERLRSCKS